MSYSWVKQEESFGDFLLFLDDARGKDVPYVELLHLDGMWTARLIHWGTIGAVYSMEFRMPCEALMSLVDRNQDVTRDSMRIIVSAALTLTEAVHDAYGEEIKRFAS